MSEPRLARLVRLRWPGIAGLWAPLAVLVVALGLWLALHAGVTVALERAHLAAERQALERTDQALETALQVLQRNLEGYELYFELLRDRVRTPAGGSDLLPGVEYRLRSFAAAERFGVFQASIVSADAVLRWTTLTGDIAVPLPERAPYIANLIEDVGLSVSLPVQGQFSGRTGIQLSRRLLDAGDSYLGVAVLSVNPATLAGQLRALRRRPGERISLWRNSGEMLASSVAETPVGTRTGIRPGPEGHLLDRLVGPLTGEDRFIAARRVPGMPLFLSVSRLAEPELADFAALQQTMRWTEALLFLLLMATGGLGWLGLARRRAAQAARAAQQAEVARVLNGVPAAVGLMLMHGDGRIERLYLSAGAERLVRLPPGALAEARGFGALMEPVMTEAGWREVTAQVRRAGEMSFDRQTRCGDGGLRWLRYTYRAIGRDGASLEVVALITDVEAQRAAEAAALSSARLATLGELSANLAHEINQPLAVIGLRAETAQLRLAEGNTVAVREALDRIWAMVRRTAEITDQLRRFARAETPELAPIALREVLAGALLLAGGSLREAEVRLEDALPAALPEVLGQKMLLEQVLMNLLLNARDAMVAAEVPEAARRVRVSAEVAEDCVRLVVADSGPGIAPAALGRLFEPFFTTKPAGSGTGLGLSICHGILRGCGGAIAAANAPGGGAVFTLTLRRSAGARPVEAAPPLALAG